MPMPSEGTAWLPDFHAPAFDRYQLNEAIWLNDTAELGKILRGGSQSNEAGRAAAGRVKRKGLLVDIARRWGWQRIGDSPANEKRTDLPVPIGGSIAALSAGQLMAEAPTVRLFETKSDGKRAQINNEQQARLDLFANSDDAHMTLLEAAETAAAIGGVVLKAAWDVDDKDRESVWFDSIGADCSLPEFNGNGRLVAVSLFQEYPADGSKVFRHIERHSIGFIEHALYLGTESSIGKLAPLDKVEALSYLLEADHTMDGLVAVIPTGLERLTAQFWRNRPARAWRRSGNLANLGRSDFESIEPLIDAYSELWGSAMRDVRLGKARLLVPVGMLDSMGAGDGGSFDPDREIFTEVGGLDPESGTNTIKDTQPGIRWQEHLNLLAAAKMEILDGAGWSMASYGNPVGIDSGGAATATEVNDRTTKSERTRDAKALEYKSAANPFFRMLAELDGLMYPGKGSGPITNELAIDFPDVSQVNPAEQARTFLDLSTANAISIEQTVRERRPNWDEEQVRGEVAKIAKQMADVNGSTLADPSTFGRETITLDATDPNPEKDGTE